MEIRVGSLLRGAQEAEGTVIIIDVFRCFTTAAVAFSRGAEKIILVAEVQEALDLKSSGVGELCVGEVSGMMPDGFDFGNSPSQLAVADVRGKTLIQSTRAGTVGVTAAKNASQIYGGSLVVAQSTAKAILKNPPDLVSIVAMGAGALERADEDEQCALYIRNLLLGRTPDNLAVRNLILAGEEAQKYGDPARPHFPLEDRDMALEIDTVPFAIKIGTEDGLLVARPESA
ncbi:MAG: 2-phosphosulfolactate phosphatase [Chloroflexi bacterium]|nr:2-phosphosulfolactate phosphatase [Chloroflexota bacterium]MDA1228888.1 2-phosphosulfolactate phosphatase [Chloroflexota bacterium]